MKKIRLLVGLLLFTILCTTGCGNNTSPEKETVSEQASIDATGQDSNTTINAPINTADENILNVSSYTPLEYDESEMDELDENGQTGYYYMTGSSTYSFTCGSKFYSFIKYNMKEPKESTLWMHTYDMDTNTLEKTQIVPKLPQFESYTIDSVKLINNERLALKVYINSQDGDGYYVLLETDMSGKTLSITEPFPDAERYPWFQKPESNIQIFGNGDGSFFLREWDDTQETTKLYNYIPETAERTLIANFDEYPSSLCTNDGENIYYTSNYYIKKYNTKDKTTEQLCNILDLGVPSVAAGSCLLLINEAGNLALVDHVSETNGVYFLTDGSAINTEKSLVPFANISIYDPYYTRRQAAAFSSQSLSCTVPYETAKESDSEAYRDRIIMEIANGKGPELMWVSREDMLMLDEKGVLMDLTELVSSDIKEQLFPGVLEAGTIDGRLVGIAPEVSFVTMTTPDTVWSKDSWTVTDIIQIASTREDWQIPFFFNFSEMDRYSLFYSLAKDWDNSPYMDMEQGISHFNSDAFVNTLKLCEKYGNAGIKSHETDTVINMMRSGDSIAQVRYLYDGLVGFSTLMKQNGDDCHIVGFPTEGESGNYLFSDGYLVVNANAEHTKEISDFIAHLLDYENQFTVTFSSVRRDVIENSTLIDEFDGKAYLKKSANGQHIAEIETKSDGTTYLAEFIEFAESCRPEPYRPNDITTIIGEEFSYYFSGSKSAEDVAEIIHQRVQLYFDENK